MEFPFNLTLLQIDNDNGPIIARNEILIHRRGPKNKNFGADSSTDLSRGLVLSVAQVNRSFAASHSRGTKPPCWRAKAALGQDKQRKLPFKIMYGLLGMSFVCLVSVRLLLSSVAVLYHVNA